jgi:hypothetical protein
MDFQRKFISIGKDFLSDRKAVVQVGDTVYSETFNLEVGCVRGSLSIWAMSVSSQLVNHNSAAVQQDQIVSLVVVE